LPLDLDAFGQSMALITANPELAAGYAGRTARLTGAKIVGDTAQAGCTVRSLTR
jgi:hypothetical protein